MPWTKGGLETIFENIFYAHFKRTIAGIPNTPLALLFLIIVIFFGF